MSKITREENSIHTIALGKIIDGGFSKEDIELITALFPQNINKLENKVIDLQNSTEQFRKDSVNFMKAWEHHYNLVKELQSKLDKVRDYIKSIDYRGNRNNDIVHIERIIEEEEK